MRLVIQRVTSASVSTEAAGCIGNISKGLCVLVGIGQEDTEDDVTWCRDRILDIGMWPSADNKPWKTSVRDDPNMQVLLVSQFTLYGKVYKKKKLDFHNALAPDAARALYQSLISSVSSVIGEDRTQAGEFGAYMEVALTNDGPVTILLDSKEK